MPYFDDRKSQSQRSPQQPNSPNFKVHRLSTNQTSSAATTASSAGPIQVSGHAVSAAPYAPNNAKHRGDVNVTLCALEPNCFDNLAFEVAVPPREAAKLYKTAYRQHSYKQRAPRAPCEGFLILT